MENMQRYISNLNKFLTVCNNVHLQNPAKIKVILVFIALWISLIWEEL
jgi:hypothetical protein